MSRAAHSAFVVGLSILTFAGCRYDVEIPPPPMAGTVAGTLGLGGHADPGDRELKLFAEDGSYKGTRTAASGAFVFGDVKPGLYFVEVRLPGFVPLVRPNVRVGGGATVELGTLELAWAPADSTVVGKATVPVGGSAEGGRVELTLEALSQKVASAPLADDGTFVVRVPPGVYGIKALHPLYVSATLAGVQVPDGARLDVSDQPLALALNPARLTGLVYRERDGQPAVPAAGAAVTLDTGDTTVTDVDGRYVLSGLPAGARTVRVSLAGWNDPLPPRSVTLLPGSNVELEPLNLALDRGVITGTVELADGQTARDVTVSLVGAPYSMTAVTSATTPSRADFRLNDVPVGTWELVAFKQGYQPGSVGSVQVSAKQTTAVPALTLVVQSGAFVIDDGDPASTPGFTRVRDVTLQLATTTAARYRASQDSTFAGVPFGNLTGPNQPFSLTGPEGTKTVYVQFQDGAGINGPVLQASVVYDVTPPANLSLLLNGGEAFTRVAQPLFATLQAQDVAATGADAASGLKSVRLSANGTPDAQGVLQGTAQPYQRDLIFVRPASTEGVQRVYAQFFDHAGNPSAIVPAEITVDVTPPSGSMTIGQGPRATLPGYTNQPLVELQQTVGTEPDGGFVLVKLGNTQAELNAAVYQPVRAVGSWFIDPASDGQKTVLAMLRDAAGNTSGTLSATITYDTTPPSPVSLTIPAGSVTRAASVTLSASATDTNPLSPTQALTLSEDPLFVSAGQVGPQALGAPQPASVVFPLSAGDGLKRVFARFRDAAGNDASAQVTVTRDTEAPTGSVLVRGTLADGTSSTTLTSSATVTVLITQSGATEYLVGNDTLGSCPSTGYLALPSNGVLSGHVLSGTASPREVRVCLRDGAGNVSAPVVGTITLDTSAPASCALALTGARADGLTLPALPAGKTGSPYVRATVSGCAEAPVEYVLSASPITCSAGAALAWQPYTAITTVTLTGGDGPNSVYGCVRDAARNTGNIGSASITLDTTPPRVTSFVLKNGAAYFNLADYQAASSTLDVSATATATGASEWAVGENASFGAFATFVSGTPVTVRLGGAGTRTVSALVRDDVGNEAPVVSDSIEVDITPITGGSLSLLSPTNNSFTNSVSITASLTAPADTTAVQLASAAGASCASTDFTGAITRSMSPTFGFVLPPGDGLKRVCARLFDAAGNVGSLIPATITLDTTPPTAPQLVTNSRYTNAANGTAVTVTTIGPVTEANFDRYQRLGGLQGGVPLSQWADDSTALGTTSFNFSLQSSATVAEVPNVLRLRARDLAGNVSPEATVVITTDIVPPQPVQLDPLWVQNAAGRGTVHWTKSVSTDVVGYRVYYSSTTQQPAFAVSGYRGTFALQGASPVLVGDVGSTTLSGLANGSTTFVTVRPMDRAGNEGPAPSSARVEVQVQPNVVSPDWLGSVTTSMSEVVRLQVVGSYAYAWGLGAGGATSVLQPIDLSTIESPIGPSALTTTPALPVPLAAQVFNDGVASIPYAARGLDLAHEGQYLFTTSGTKVRIFSLKNPRAPALVSTLDVSALSPAAFSVAVKGNTLFVGGESADQHSLLIAYDISKLFDHNALTVPSAVDLLGAVQGAWSWAIVSIALTREFAVTSTLIGGSGVFYFVTGALDGPAGAPYANSAYNGTDGQLGVLPTRNVVSGNLLFSFADEQTAIGSLNRLWFFQGPPWAAPVATVGAGNAGQSAAAGTQLFLGDPTVLGVRVLDFSELPTLADHGAYRIATGRQGSVAVYGNYLLTADAGGGRVNVSEIARPVAPRSIASTSSGYAQSELSPGLLISSGGAVIDLTTGSPPRTINADTGVCSIDMARVGDVMISGANEYRVNNMEDAIDRDPATVWDFDDRYAVTPATPMTVSGLDAVGHQVIATEVRTGAQAGVWLKVIDGRKLLRRATWNSWAPLGSDVVGEVQVTTSASATVQARLTMHEGRALVVLEDSAVAGDSFFVVDLRPLLDDDAATTVSAPANIVQARLALGSIHGGVIRGNHAFLATPSGLTVVSIAEAMDELPATTVPGTTPRTSLALVGGAEAVTVYGSYAYATPTQSATPNKGFQVIDVRAPLSPTVVASLPMAGPSNNCSARGSVHVSGSRAYLTGFQRTEILELE